MWAQYGLSYVRQNLPRPGIKPMSLALAGRFLTIGLPGTSKKTAILNVYKLSYRAAKYVKQKPFKMKGEIDKSAVTVGDFSALINN